MPFFEYSKLLRLTNPSQIAYLNHVTYLLAPHVLTNTVLAERFPAFTEDQILKNTGISQRYAIEPGTIASDFAAACGTYFFEEFPVDKTSIDFLVFCSEAPDYVGPATSCIIQHKLGLPTNIGTLDLAFGCSGYTYGLSISKALIESGMASNILFITTDIPTSVLPPGDPMLHFLFSDGASASLISAKPSGPQIGNFAFGTDGSGESSLRVRNSAISEPKDHAWLDNPQNEGLRIGRMEMDGEAIFSFSLREVPQLVEQILDKNRCTMEDIDLFIFHQASSIILKSLKRKLRIPDNRFFSNLAEVGNTVSASIPVAYTEAVKQGKITKGMKVLIAGFGIGYSWSGTVIQH